MLYNLTLKILNDLIAFIYMLLVTVKTDLSVHALIFAMSYNKNFDTITRLNGFVCFITA